MQRQHVAVAGRDQRPPGQGPVTVLGLLDGDRAEAVEAAGEGGGEAFSGMCCTMTMPGDDAGRASSTSRMASVPPVEAPMQMIGRHRHGRLRRRSAPGARREHRVRRELGLDLGGGPAGASPAERACAAALAASQMRIARFLQRTARCRRAAW
jgi:hypothetical protein